MASPPSVVVVAWDAADPDLLRRWAGEGRLPAVADLLESGRVVPVRTPVGLYVGAVWPSFWTSTSPARHGRYCYKQLEPGTYRVGRVGARDVAGRPFWETLSERGRRVAVVDVPKTRLSEGLHGVQVVDWGTHDPEAAGCSVSPAAFGEDLVARHGSDPVGPSCDRRRSTAAEFAEFRDAVLRRVRAKEGIGHDLLDRGGFDLVVLGFSDAHCAGHQTWHLHDASHERHDAATARALGDPLRDVYEALDSSLGRLRGRLPEETTLLWLTSHGMGPHHDGSRAFDEALRRIDATLPFGRRARWWARLGPLLDHGWSRRLDARLGGILRVPSRHAPRRCFAVPNNEAFAGVRLNLVGREPAGRIRPGAEEDAFCAALSQALLEVRNADTGEPVFARVLRTDREYGPGGAGLPDLMAEWRREAPIHRLASTRLGVVEAPYRGPRTGDHRPEGLLAACGPGIEPGRRAAHAAIEDVGPTVAALLGVDLPGVDGRVIEDLVGTRCSPSA